MFCQKKIPDNFANSNITIFIFIRIFLVTKPTLVWKNCLTSIWLYSCSNALKWKLEILRTHIFGDVKDATFSVFYITLLKIIGQWTKFDLVKVNQSELRKAPRPLFQAHGPWMVPKAVLRSQAQDVDECWSPAAQGVSRLDKPQPFSWKSVNNSEISNMARAP